MVRVEHIGIAVKDLEVIKKLYNKLFDQSPYKTESVEREHVDTLFYKIGETKIEFLQATAASSAIHSFIEKRAEGIHHIAFEVEDIQKEMDRLRTEGFTLLRDEPFEGADNKWVCFLHPKSTNGVLVELCQEIPQTK